MLISYNFRRTFINLSSNYHATYFNLCIFYATVIHLPCNCYSTVMRLLCNCRATAMQLTRNYYALTMHLLCNYHATVMKHQTTSYNVLNTFILAVSVLLFTILTQHTTKILLMPSFHWTFQCLKSLHVTSCNLHAFFIQVSRNFRLTFTKHSWNCQTLLLNAYSIFQIVNVCNLGR